MARRGRPPRSEDVAGYLAWRRAEERAAEGREGPAPAPLVAASGFLDVSTVWDWRRTVPSVAAWRAWLVERWPELAETVAAGELDDVRSAITGPTPTAAIAAFHATMIPRLDADLSQLRGRRPSVAELARLTGASARTVKRHRAEYRPMDGPGPSVSGSTGDGNARSKEPRRE